MSNSRNFATLGSNSSSGGIVTNITSIGALTNSASSNTIYLFGVSNYQNNYIQSVFNTANSASSNTIYLQGALNQTNNNIVNANTQLKAYVDGAFYTKSGGNISGPVIINSSLLVTGNLTVSGNVVTVSANNLSVQDNMIYLNQGDTGYLNPDLGFAGAYNDGTYHHAGFFRDHTTGVWKVFDNYLPEPDASPWIDQSNSSFRIANFQANTVTANLFSGSGASLTSLSANNLSGTIPSGVLGNSTQYIGTTAVALNRASASQSLTGVSIDGSAGSAAASSLTGTTLASGVTSSSLTSVGNLNSLNVNGLLKTSATGNPLYFTSAWSGYPDANTVSSEISNDSGSYQRLMIVGNKSAGSDRRVGVWDRLAINGGNFSYNLSVTGAIYASDNITAYSDIRKKTDIITIDDALNKVKQLRGVYYKRIDRPDYENKITQREIGVIAQELKEIIPEVIYHSKETDEFSVAHGPLIGLLIEAMKEQQLQIESLKDRLDNISNK